MLKKQNKFKIRLFIYFTGALFLDFSKFQLMMNIIGFQMYCNRSWIITNFCRKILNLMLIGFKGISPKSITIRIQKFNYMSI